MKSEGKILYKKGVIYNSFQTSSKHKKMKGSYFLFGVVE